MRSRHFLKDFNQNCFWLSDWQNYWYNLNEHHSDTFCLSILFPKKTYESWIMDATRGFHNLNYFECDKSYWLNMKLIGSNISDDTPDLCMSLYTCLSWKLRNAFISALCFVTLKILFIFIGNVSNKKNICGKKWSKIRILFIYTSCNSIESIRYFVKSKDILVTFIEMYYFLNIINKLREYKTKRKWFFSGCEK